MYSAIKNADKRPIYSSPYKNLYFYQLIFKILTIGILFYKRLCFL